MYVLKKEDVTRVFLADAHPQERAALRLMLLDIKMAVVGEAAAWPAVLAEAPASRPDMLLVDSGLLSAGSAKDLVKLRCACPMAVIVLLIGQLDTRRQTELIAGADAFISKDETPERVAERLRVAAVLDKS